MPKLSTDLKAPCSDCPFRTAAAPGWLGPWSALGLYRFIRQAPFICHKTMKRDVSKAEMLMPDADLTDMQLCRGSVEHLKKCASTHPHNQVTEQLATVDRDQLDKILGLDFIKHHEREH